MRKIYLLILLLTCVSLYVSAQNKDWAGYNRYEKSNKELAEKENDGKRIVFLGNSITENWMRLHPDFFNNNDYIPRGIGGQTSFQFLVRFREDVINLHPKIVVINAGTNDVAENIYKYDPERTMGNIISMVELAKANKIKVVLTSVLPAGFFPWRKEIKNVVEKISDLNSRIEKYAKKAKVKYVDYYSAMVDDKGASRAEYTRDGVHPKSEGYVVMEAIIKPVLDKMR